MPVSGTHQHKHPTCCHASLHSPRHSNRPHAAAPHPACLLPFLLLVNPLQIFDLESNYFQVSSAMGNAIRGYEGFVGPTKKTAPPVLPEERLFSWSSATGQVGRRHHGTRPACRRLAAELAAPLLPAGCCRMVAACGAPEPAACLHR